MNTSNYRSSGTWLDRWQAATGLRPSQSLYKSKKYNGVANKSGSSNHTIHDDAMSPRSQKFRRRVNGR